MGSSPTQRLDWLGFAAASPLPQTELVLVPSPAWTGIGPLLGIYGNRAASEATDIQLSFNVNALHLRATCHVGDMSRVRADIDKTVERDHWGSDAVEVQIDPYRDGREYFHFILTPGGEVVTFRAGNNRTIQGWHPDVPVRATLADDAWRLEADFPFSLFEKTPASGETWGFNIFRANPIEPEGLTQWRPTFGAALSPEISDLIRFGGDAPVPATRSAEGRVARHREHRSDQQNLFQRHINRVTEEDALREIGYSSWEAWGDYLAACESPRAIRWSCIHPGTEGIPDVDRPITMEKADALVTKFTEGSSDEAYWSLFLLEPLADAWLLTGGRKYVDAFEAGIHAFTRLLDTLLPTVVGAPNTFSPSAPYSDSQVVDAAVFAGAYRVLAHAGLSTATHAATMRILLRAGRYAAYHIGHLYVFGNHQFYESGGFAALAALTPEFAEQQDWARRASRAIRIHCERELYDDGAWAERCVGYHACALRFVMHAVTLLRQNDITAGFEDLLNPPTINCLEKMYEWLLYLACPDGSVPAFGDSGAHSCRRMLLRGATIFGRNDFAWPVKQSSPELLPPEMKATDPAVKSMSLPSHFTVMRDSWDRDALYMAVDHGPLGGQHSHCDSMGFVAFAYGRLIAGEAGLGQSYDDPLYLSYYRKPEAHSIVVVDGCEPEKISECTDWRTGDDKDYLTMRSRGYHHQFGLLHERQIVFLHGIGWLIHDRLWVDEARDDTPRQAVWTTLSPLPLVAVAPDRLHGAVDGVGMVLLLEGADEAPSLDHVPGSVPNSAPATHRAHEQGGKSESTFVQEVTRVQWTRPFDSNGAAIFTTALLPYRDELPQPSLRANATGWTLEFSPGHSFEIPNSTFI